MDASLLELFNKIPAQFYGKQGEIKPLPGELDYNFLFTSEEGEQFVLKILHPDRSAAWLDFQVQLLEHLAKTTGTLSYPKVISSVNGEPFFLLNHPDSGASYWVWMLSYVEGRVWAEVNPKTADLRKQLGHQLAVLQQALEDFDHPYAHRFIKWDPAKTDWVKEILPLVADDGKRALASYFFQLFQEKVPALSSLLPMGINHNDANDYNVVVSLEKIQPKVVSIIDFGDSVFTFKVNEVAIAAAYATMRCEDPLAALMDIGQGFHQQRNFHPAEIEALFPLLAARLLISVVCATQNSINHPDNPYLQISADDAWAMLEKWRQFPPDFIHFALRAACGWEACPMKLHFEAWKTQFNPTYTIVPYQPKIDRIATLDLSVGSLDLGNTSQFEDDDNFEQTMHQMLVDKKVNIGIGGYGEIRPFYTTDQYSVTGNEGPKWRTVHLGLDIWMPAFTPVFATIPGIVDQVADNKGDRDYGPTVILKHELQYGGCFYTLYGHLSQSTLSRVQVGQPVQAGQCIGFIGPRPENGNWPPHLHFQILLDSLDQNGDFPGVGFPEYWNVWKSICPDPMFLSGLGHESSKDKVLEESTILHHRRSKIGPNLSISYQKPLHIVRGFKQYLYHADGRRYLDMVNNVAHVGHEHPEVVRAAQRQIAVLNTNSRYLHERLTVYANELLETFPEPLSVCYLVNSGSEANELALRLAKTYTNSQQMMALEVGYHGSTTGALDISDYKFNGKGGQGTPTNTHIAPMPNLYRGPFQNPETAGSEYALLVENLLDRIHEEGQTIAGFFAESILSCGGQVMLPDGYLPKVYELIRNQGGLCIADEVQVGFGRVGKHFWGFELQDVVPDIVTLGKPIGNGHPIGAVVTTRAVADAFNNGMEFFSTFGGNPVSCAVGQAVIEVIKTEKLQDHALTIGNFLLEEMKNLQTRHPIIGDVRGTGLFLGMEFVETPTLRTPATQKASYFVNRMREHGVLLSTDGPFENVIKIKPPMCFDQENAELFLALSDKILREDFMRVT